MQAMSYARSTSRILVVDWRDEDWVHDPSEPLSDYLSIHDIDTLPIADSLTELNQNQRPRSIVPKAWKAQLFTNQFSTFIRNGTASCPRTAPAWSRSSTLGTLILKPKL